MAEIAMEKAAKEGHWVILQVQLKERCSYLNYFNRQNTFSHVRMGRI